MNNKKYFFKSGFTLVEAVIAILILGVSFPVIFAFQSKLLRNVFNAHEYISRIFYIKNFFIKADLEKLYTKKDQINQKSEDPSLNLVYSTKNAKDFKNFSKYKNLLIEKIDIDWSLILKNNKETFVKFRFYIK